MPPGGLPPGAAELASGRFELTIGEPEQWVPGHRDHKAIRARARHILPPLTRSAAPAPRPFHRHYHRVAAQTGEDGHDTVAG